MTMEKYFLVLSDHSEHPEVMHFDGSPLSTGADLERHMMRSTQRHFPLRTSSGRSLTKIRRVDELWEVAFTPSMPEQKPAPSNSVELFLEVISGPDAGRQFPLRRGHVLSIGRAGQDIAIADPSLPTNWATLEINSAGITLHEGHGVQELALDTPYRWASSMVRLSHATACTHRTDISALYHPLAVEMPPPRNKLQVVLMLSLPLLLGVGIALFTHTWFFLLMAVGSSLMMGVNMWSSQGLTRQARQDISAAVAQDALRATQVHTATCAGFGEEPQAGILVLGTGSRPAHLRCKNLPEHRIPTLDNVPLHLPLDTTKPNFLYVETEAASLRQLLLQLVAKTPRYICISDILAAQFPDLFQPLLIFPTVRCAPVQMLQREASVGDILIVEHCPAISVADSNTTVVIVNVDATDRNVQFPPDTSWVKILKTPHNSPAQWEIHTSSAVNDVMSSQLFSAHRLIPDGISQSHYLQKLVDIHDAPAQQNKFHQLPQHFTLQASLHPHFNVKNVLHQWDQKVYDETLNALIGTTRGTEFHLDLSHHGPHFLIAGTTGSGKSQLLRTLLLSLIYSYSPQRLAFLIIDFKGEAGLGPFSRSPHCKALISDLDESDFERTMLFLQADLTQREQMFKNLGISSYKDLVELRRRTHEPLDVPELLVVVDEFKMLIDKFPSAMAKLIKVATVGRSLGIHLILSTQRPQGTVSSDITSNIGTTICLRVASELESTTLIGTTDAAKISPHHPGSGFIKAADTELLPFQALHIDKQREDEQKVSFALTRLATGQKTVQHDVATQQIQEDEVLLGYISALPSAPAAQEYCPVPQRPRNAPLPTKPHVLPLGIIEVAQKGRLQSLYVDSKTSPVSVIASRTDCFALTQNLFRRGIESGFNVYVATGDFSSFRQLQQAHLQNTPAPNALISPFDADFLVRVLHKIESNTENVLILDAIDLWLEENQKNFGAINQLTQFITQAEAKNTLVIALASQSLRGKFGQLFMSKVWSRSSFLQDPLLSATRNTLKPAHQKCYVEGEIVRKIFINQEVHAGELTLVTSPGAPISDARVNPRFIRQVPLRVTPEDMSRFVKNGKQAISLFGDFPRSQTVLLGLGTDKKPQSIMLPPNSLTIVLGPRLSGKSQLFHTIQELNPTLKCHIVHGTKTQSLEEINNVLGHVDDPLNTLVCIDDAQYLTYDAQKVIVKYAQQFQHILCNSVPTPKALSMPLLAEHNGATRGIYLCPSTDREAEFFTPGAIPLDFRTEGSVPAGRAIIVQDGECSTVQIAISEEK